MTFNVLGALPHWGLQWGQHDHEVQLELNVSSELDSHLYDLVLLTPSPPAADVGPAAAVQHIHVS